MRIISATIGPLAAANASIIAEAQTGAANTKLTLTASPYTLDFPRRVIITPGSGNNDSGVKFTIVGTDWNGYPVTEVLAGGNNVAVQSLYDYATIASITPNGSTGANMTVGTNGVASTRPIFLDEWAFGPTALQINVSGTANATVRQSLDDPNSGGYTSINWVNHPDSNLVNLTGTVQGNYAYLPKVVQLLLNSGGTGTSSVTIRVSQSASVPL